MITKICTDCGAEKPDTKEFFAVSKYREDGTVTLRGKCKECKNKEDRERKGKQQPGQNKPVKEKPAPQPVQQIKSDNIFTADEVILLREIMKNYKQEPEVINLTPEPKSRRLKKTYNLDMDLVHWINEAARDKGVSASDIVNSLLRQVIK